MSEFEKIGKYEVIGKIGQGSFGVVYRGRDPYLKRDVAIKICSVEDEDLRRRFFREAEISGRLQHRNVVTVFDFGLEGGIPYLVQEHLSGEDLDGVIKRREVLPVTTKLGYLIQVAQGLASAHEQGIIHRDIKPGNVRLLENGQVKIMDFGIAKLASAETQLTQKGVTMGTASYLPPEQVRGGELDHRADIFSFGVLAYELLTYERPFGGNTLSALVYQILYKVPTPMSGVWPECPEELSDVVARCLEKKPEHRYDNCSQVAAALEAVCQGIAAGRWPALQGAAPPLAGAVRQSGTGEVMSQTQVSRTAREVTGAVETSKAQSERPTEVRRPPIRDIDSTQPVSIVPPVAEPPADARAAASTQVVSVVNPAAKVDPLLATRVQEIGRLIAQGDRDQAMRELEETLSRHKGAAAAPPPPTVSMAVPVTPPPAPPVAAAPPPPLPVVPPVPVAPVVAAPPPSAKQGKQIDSIEITRPLPIGAASIGPAADPASVVMEPPPPLPSLSARLPALDSIPAPVPVVEKRAGGGGLKWLLLGGALFVILAGALAIAGWWLFGRSPEPPPAPVVSAPPPPVETAAAPTGFVAINALPWGEVREITNAEGFVQAVPGSRATPLYLALPPGSYKIALTSPDHPEVLECDVVVNVGLATSCNVTFKTPDVTQYFKESGWWK